MIKSNRVASQAPKSSLTEDHHARPRLALDRRPEDSDQRSKDSDQRSKDSDQRSQDRDETKMDSTEVGRYGTLRPMKRLESHKVVGEKEKGELPVEERDVLPAQPEEDSNLEDDSDEADIVLVETNHPKVVEEDRDLVILEHVDVAIPDPEPAKPVVQFPIPVNAQPVIVHTPQRSRRVGRSGRTSLYRAICAEGC